MVWSSGKKGFTLSELLIGLALIGLLSVLVLPTIFNTNSSSEVKISEALKSDVAKAFQIEAVKNGGIQASSSPSDIISKSLLLSNPQPVGSIATEYTTSNNWKVTIPNTWEEQSSGPDKADITMVSDKGSSYTISIFRNESKIVSRNNLAVIQPVVLGSQVDTSQPIDTTQPNITTPTTSSPAPSRLLSTWTATITVSSQTGTPIEGATVTGVGTGCGGGTTDSSGTYVSGGILSGTSCSYTATASGYSSGNSGASVFIDGNKNFTITLTQITRQATVRVTNASTGAVIAGANISSTNCKSGTTTSTGEVLLTGIADGTSCTYTAQATGYSSNNSATLTMDADKTFNIILTPIVTTRTARVTVLSSVGATPITGANVVSTTCGGGVTDGTGLAQITGITNGISCTFSASATGYANGASASQTMTADKSFTVTLAPVRTATITVTNSVTGATISGATVTGSTNCPGGTTPATGVLSISNIPNNQSCTYSVSKSGFTAGSPVTKTMSSNQSFALQLIPIPSCLSTETAFNGQCYTNADIRNIQNLRLAPTNPDGTSNPRSQIKIPGTTSSIGQIVNWSDFINSTNTKIYLGGNANNVATVSGNMCPSIGISCTSADGLGSSTNLVGAYGFATKIQTWTTSGPTGSNTQVKNYLSNNVIIYTAPPESTTPGKQFFIVGIYYSPIKINLLGLDAKINSTNHFNFDTDGFYLDNMPIIRTSGGLNPDEAWLIMDRENNGIGSNAGKKAVLDGNDTFGDHMGRFPSGYEDLAASFKGEIKTDIKGTGYIELHKLSWIETLWIQILRFFHLAQNPIASMDLYLLDINGHKILASHVFSRIDITYKNVQEFDADRKNAIFQRANVTYLDGHTAQSADQWFSPTLVLKPVNNKGKSMLLDLPQK